MVSYKLVTKLDDLPRARHARRLPVTWVDALLALLCAAIMGTAVYVGSKQSGPAERQDDHIGYLAGRSDRG